MPGIKLSPKQRSELAQALLSRGMTPYQSHTSPYQTLGRLAQTFAGVRQMSKANEAQTAQDAQLAQALAGIAEAGKVTPEALGALGNNPQLAASLLGSQLGRDQQNFAREDQQAFTAEQAGLNRQQRADLQAGNQAFTRELKAEEFDFRGGQAAADRKLRREEAAATRKQKQQVIDQTMRDNTNRFEIQMERLNLDRDKFEASMQATGDMFRKGANPQDAYLKVLTDVYSPGRFGGIDKDDFAVAQEMASGVVRSLYGAQAAFDPPSVDEYALMMAKPGEEVTLSDGRKAKIDKDGKPQLVQ